MSISIKKMNDLSRIISHALRHEPLLYELEIDQEGWVPVKEILSALKKIKSEYENIAESELIKMIDISEKKRHEILKWENTSSVWSFDSRKIIKAISNAARDIVS